MDKMDMLEENSKCVNFLKQTLVNVEEVKSKYKPDGTTITVDNN